MRHAAAKDYLVFQGKQSGYSATAQHIDTVRNWYGNDQGREMAASMFAVLQIRPAGKRFPAKDQRTHASGKAAGNSGCSEGRHAFSLCGGIPPERRAPLGRGLLLCRARAGRMLLPDGIIPPDGGSVKAFLPDALAPLILFNTACDVLSRRRQPPGEECITLLDPKGRLARRQAACWPSPPWYGLSQIMPPYMSKLLSRLWRIMGRRF